MNMLRALGVLCGFFFDGYLLIGIITCALGVPGSINQGKPLPNNASSRWLDVDTPIVSGVAFGTDITHSF